jgi:hypothetical protein
MKYRESRATYLHSLSAAESVYIKSTGLLPHLVEWAVLWADLRRREEAVCRPELSYGIEGRRGVEIVEERRQ